MRQLPVQVMAILVLRDLHNKVLRVLLVHMVEVAVALGLSAAALADKMAETV
jgi:hypothetical protein